MTNEAKPADIAAPVLYEGAIVLEHAEFWILVMGASLKTRKLNYWNVPESVVDGDIVTLAVERVPGPGAAYQDGAAWIVRAA